ncbi:MAG TPA: AbrB/MazE/SpoVT family DNA-binding domain-containing protein [Caulifigura sp.]|jgi:antitoxin MazE|nr:AbrB/MazE/SpoVT family DNA-binding domain-containing protein [Caulifigura sp.]
MRASVKKWGNSASIRIPSAVLSETNLKIDDPVDIRSEGGRIVIEPVEQAGYDIDDLVAGITDENLHGEVDFGPAVGNEVW